MQLAVGPTALVSLLVSTLVNKYGAEPGSQDALNVATQAALSAGIIMVPLSLLNLGSFIQFVAHPVMNGFITGAAFIIGQQQLKSFFGFNNKPPQLGQEGYEYNYLIMKWYHNHWNSNVQINTGTGSAPIWVERPAQNYQALYVKFYVNLIIIFSYKFVVVDRCWCVYPSASG
jgi:MFS superfamily sulfate permease-like transporter